MTALSGEALARNNVNDTAGLVAMTPSLTFTDGAQPNNRNFRIRGIGTAVFGQGLEPSVSVVMDGIPLARASQGFSDLADIERVEVLRGPQGTLFGKNSVGGVINVVTKRPSKEFEANVDATFAEEQEYRVRGSHLRPDHRRAGRATHRLLQRHRRIHSQPRRPAMTPTARRAWVSAASSTGMRPID